MKKTAFAAALAVICLIFCFSACGKEEVDCYQLYRDAEQKTASLDKFSAGVGLSLGVDMGSGGAVSILSDTKMDADIAASRYVQTVSNTDAEGGKQNVTVFHEAGVTYFTDGYNSYKYAEDDATAMSSVSHVADFDIPKDAFAEAKLTDESGVRSVECTASGESMKTLCSTYLYPVNVMTGAANDYSLSDVKITIKINADGYLVDTSFAFSAEFDYEGENAAAVVDVDIAYTDVSGKTVVTGPDGYADFPEYSDDTADPSVSGDDMSERDALAIDAAFSLFEDDHVTRVANYDELYERYCAEYGKDTMDSIIELIVALGSMSGD